MGWVGYSVRVTYKKKKTSILNLFLLRQNQNANLANDKPSEISHQGITDLLTAKPPETSEQPLSDVEIKKRVDMKIYLQLVGVLVVILMIIAIVLPLSLIFTSVNNNSSKIWMLPFINSSS